MNTYDLSKHFTDKEKTISSALKTYGYTFRPYFALLWRILHKDKTKTISRDVTGYFFPYFWQNCREVDFF